MSEFWLAVWICCAAFVGVRIWVAHRDGAFAKCHSIAILVTAVTLVALAPLTLFVFAVEQIIEGDD